MPGRTKASRRARRRGAGLEEVAITVLLFVVITLGTLQIALFVRDQMRLERTSDQIVDLISRAAPGNAPNGDMQTLLLDMLDASTPYTVDDYGLTLRGLRIDRPGNRVAEIWRRSFGNLAPPRAYAESDILAAGIVDSAYLVEVRLTGRITGADLLFDAFGMGQTRRLLHTTRQYATLSPGRSNTNLTLDSATLRTVSDSQIGVQTAYAGVGHTSGSRYFEAEITSGADIQLGWVGTLDPLATDPVAQSGAGVRVDLVAGTLEYYDGTGWQNLGVSVSPGDRIGLGLNIGTSRLRVIHYDAAAGTCNPTTSPLGTSAFAQATPAASLGDVAAGSNALTTYFDEAALACLPGNHTGVITSIAR